MSDEQGSQSVTKGRVIIFCVVVPLVCIAFFPTFLLLLIGMAPSIVAVIIDNRPGKVTARAIAYLNFTGALPFALQLWTGPNSISGAIELASDPTSLMIMYSAAAAGWALNFIMSPIMTAYLSVQHEARARSISKRQEALIKEWGGEVKGQAAGQPSSQDQQEASHNA